MTTLQEKLAATEAEYAKVEQEEKEAWRIWKEAQAKIEPLDAAWHKLYQRQEHLRKIIEALKELTEAEPVKAA